MVVFLSDNTLRSSYYTFRWRKKVIYDTPNTQWKFHPSLLRRQKKVAILYRVGFHTTMKNINFMECHSRKTRRKDCESNSNNQTEKMNLPKGSSWMSLKAKTISSVKTQWVLPQLSSMATSRKYQALNGLDSSGSSRAILKQEFMIWNSNMVTAWTKVKYWRQL